jgi:peptidyl-prolyl cis-trans isomerase A (cyclophilin A)
MFMARIVPLLAILALGGCNASLKDYANRLEDRITDLEAQVKLQETRVHELERELDTCQLEVERKAITVILDEAGVAIDEPLFADIVTSMGTIRAELFPALAPRTVANFVQLAEGTRSWTDPASGERRDGVPLYRDLPFHRVLVGYVIQTGDPLGTGFGGPGYTFPDELTTELTHDHAGVLSMANGGPDTNGSQFFITLEPATHLDRKHTQFGKVVEGLDVATAIGAVPAGAVTRHRPDHDVWLRSVQIIRP